MSAADGSPEKSTPPVAIPADVPVSAAPDRALWWEVLAVLAVGVVPDQVASAIFWTHPRQLPYTLNALGLVVISCCVSYVVLYLIRRSGEPWAAFGIVRPGSCDVAFAALLLVMDYYVCMRLGPAPPPTAFPPEHSFPLPKGVGQHILMVVKHAANGFAEELVMRAYLITRLERLLNSRVAAVVITSALWASYHLHYSPQAVISIALLGVWFGGMYLILRRVWPFALAHMATNILAELQPG
jgi:membrane protease YdiL (CAAX protease family)